MLLDANLLLYAVDARSPYNAPAAASADDVASWLELDTVWVPPASERTARVLADLVDRHHVTGNLVPDAQLAALAIEHGLVLCSADTDFARFDGLLHENPLVRWTRPASGSDSEGSR